MGVLDRHLRELMFSGLIGWAKQKVRKKENGDEQQEEKTVIHDIVVIMGIGLLFGVLMIWLRHGRCDLRRGIVWWVEG